MQSLYSLYEFWLVLGEGVGWPCLFLGVGRLIDEIKKWRKEIFFWPVEVTSYMLSIKTKQIEDLEEFSKFMIVKHIK